MVLLDSREAQRLVSVVVTAGDREAAVAAAEKAFSFLVGQLHALGERANGYPRNPIDVTVWQAGRELVSACDRFADAVSHWQQRRGEEQATRLAVKMAMQVVGHYPEEIFPRVLRNSRCCEVVGMTDEAISGYKCIINDFAALELEVLLDESPEGDEASHTVILSSVRDALSSVRRLVPQDLTDEQLALGKRIDAVLGIART